MAGDEDFLLQVYAATRAEEVARTGWDPACAEAFVRMQFEVQRRAYAMAYPDATWQVILLGDVPVGRVLVDRGPERMRLVDIALLPHHRSRGIGGALVAALQAAAASCGQPLRLHAETGSRAAGLYRRLGFVETGRAGFRAEMEWRPAGAPAAPAVGRRAAHG